MAVLGDIALTQKLSEELKYEKETGTEGVPEFLKSFKAQNVWAVRTIIARVVIAFAYAAHRLRIPLAMMKLYSAGSLAMRRTFFISYIILHQSNVYVNSIRLVFSIADIQQEAEFENENEEEGAEETNNSYPVRCSFSITKVVRKFLQIPMSRIDCTFLFQLRILLQAPSPLTPFVKMAHSSSTTCLITPTRLLVPN